ncbi:MAG: hypothetical protein J6R80_01955 [Kiritimatiellae bacterium]|nr:hypothetical protein [Kiritimatiellia bacterium]
MSGMFFLTGAPASGKTTLGRKLAERLSVPFFDLDDEISAAAGRSIPEIFSSDGEAAFRALESAALRRLVSSAPRPSVVALGGGALLRDSNREMAEKAGIVLCINTPDEEELKRRIDLAGRKRPLGNRARERAAHYASFPNRIAAFFKAGSTLVVVGNGFAAPLLAGRRVVVDGSVAKLHASSLPRPIAIVPSGEVNKTINTVGFLWSAFAADGVGRSDVVSAVGGGVTGDLTGFAAATWMRGIDWINVPTTLLSMVDASTGGKTGCDLPEGKNLAGAFHQPKLVAIDTDFLKTLSPREIASGRAEMIKHEIIGGIARGELKGLPTAEEIAANLMVKVKIVEEDPFEKLDKRILLNCGHTVAHAIEKATDYAISHGEAVAIGCVEEARLAVRMGLSPSEWPDELSARFAMAGLSTNLPAGISLDSLVHLMKGDKKRCASSVTFALPCAWGDVRAVPIDLSKGLKV